MPIVRELWKTHYQKVRLRGYPAPEEMAARRRYVGDAAHVYWFLKSRKRLPDGSEQRLELARSK